MTVAELINELKKLNSPNSNVAMGYEYDCINMIHEKITQVIEHEHKTDVILGTSDYRRD